MNSRPGDQIIIALDVATDQQALVLVTELATQVGLFKVGLQLYTAAGPDIVRAIQTRGARVFLDLKLHDIPNTVAKAVESAGELGVQMLTIHLGGGSEMIRAAVAARPKEMIILGVSVLTSSTEETLRETGVSGGVQDQVLRLAKVGVAAGVNGLVASPLETKALRMEFGNKIKIVTPGVRPTWSAPGDQKRFLTPKEALESGADYLVIGRPVTAADNPRDALERLLGEIQG